MFHLARIRVAGFRSIRDQTIELRPLNLLIGANGSGKSNFVGVFRLLNEIVSERLQVFVAQSGGADQVLHFGRKVTEKLVLDLWFGRNGYFCELVPTSGDALVFEREMVFFHLPGYATPYNEIFGGGHRETALRSTGSDVAKYVLKAMQSWKVYHFHDTSTSARIKQTGDLNDNVFLRPDAGNLAAFLYRLQETQPEVLRNLVDVIQMVAPFFDAFQLEPDRLNPDKIRLEWRERSSDTYFDAHALSDGTLRFICLATLLLQPDLPATVLLDEPELGLHPYAINVLADLLSSAATRAQVIVSTQSVTLVNQFSWEDILVVDRVDGASVFRRPDSSEVETWLDDYALGELWEKNVLGGRPGA